MSQSIDYDALSRAVMRQLMAESQKAVSSTANAVYGHGPNGLFNTPGVDPDIYNAMQLPIAGLEKLLPLYPTNMTSPVYEIITGQTATSGSEPTTACGDWPEAGVTSLMAYQTSWARFGRSTKVFDVSRVGEVTNRGEMFDYNLIGDPLASASAPNNPSFGNTDGSASLNSEIAKAMRELAVAYVRDFAKDLYTANPSNNQGTGRLYYKGLDMLINTGYQDYITTTAAPAADSTVINWGGLDIGTAPNGTNFVLQVVDMYRQFQVIADEANMNPVEWAFVGDRSLFWKLTEMWPCTYYTATCPVPAGATAFVDPVTQRQTIDDMRNNNYLLIDGKKIPFIQDTAIARTALTGADAGSYTSTLYLVPLKVRGGKAALYKQYFNFNAPNAAMDFVKKLGGNLPSYFQTTDNGRFLWLFEPPSTYCVQMQVMSRETLVLRVPYLAGRITNVRWTPLSIGRSWDTSASNYVAGGVTTR